MNDVKKLSAVLVASAMFVMNMTCAAVSAEEILSGEADVNSGAVLSDELSSGGDEDTGTDDETAGAAEGDSDGSAVQIAEEGNTEDAVEPAENDGEAGSENGDPARDAAEKKEPEPLPEPNGEDYSGSDEASSVNKGKGDIEGLVNTKVFQVTLPVQGNGLDYVADPQGLIRKTNAAKHPDSVYDENSNVFFNNGIIQICHHF